MRDKRDSSSRHPKPLLADKSLIEASRNPASAADAYRGFSLQTTRFLSRLLQAQPGAFISLEVFEDVGVELPDGRRVAEQDKSSIVGNPISNRSPGLWRTFTNWLKACDAQALDVTKTLFEIHVSHPVAPCLAKTFSEASTREGALEAVVQARRIFSSPGPSAALKPFAATVLHSDTELFATVIRHFTLSEGSGSPPQDLRHQMTVTVVPQDIIDDALNYGLGLIKQTTDQLLNDDKPAIMAVDDFRAKLTAFVRKHDRRTYLASFASIPSGVEIEGHRLKTYICQLDLVNCDDYDKVTAIKDFLRASTDRTTWSVKGWVDESSFSEFAEALERAWKNLRLQVEIELRERGEDERGRLLYARCANHQTTLEGLQLPPHFIPGSFHALSDEEIIGWHPRYQEELGSYRDRGRVDGKIESRD